MGHHGGGGTQFSNFGRHGSCEFSCSTGSLHTYRTENTYVEPKLLNKQFLPLVAGNRKDLKCVRCRLWSVTIDSHVQDISFYY